MSQHDYDIANGSGAAFRADLNLCLAAGVGLNSGSSAPSTTFAGMLWHDTTNLVVKQRNAANSAWITRWTVANAEGVFGGALTVSDAITNTKSTNTTFGPVVTNSNAGVGGQARYVASNGTSHAIMGMFGTGFATSGELQAGRGYLLNTGASLLLAATTGSIVFSLDTGFTAHASISSTGASFAGSVAATGLININSGGTGYDYFKAASTNSVDMRMEAYGTGGTGRIGTQSNHPLQLLANNTLALTATGANLQAAGTLGVTGAITGNSYGWVNSATATPAGGAANTGLYLGSTPMAVLFGSGAPTVAAAKGSLYLRSDGSATNNRMYVNTDGSTTWTAVTTAA